MDHAIFAFAALLVVGIARAGQGDSKAERGVAGVPPGVVDGPTARRLVEAGIKVIDVRTPAEFNAGHVPSAINIPYDQMPVRHSEIGPSSTPVLLYCRSGHRSGIAAGTLRASGFPTIYDMQAYDRWVASEPRR